MTTIADKNKSARLLAVFRYKPRSRKSQVQNFELREVKINDVPQYRLKNSILMADKTGKPPVFTQFLP